MRKLALAILMFALSATAGTRTVLTVTVTNAPAPGDTLTINGNVRTWVESVSTPATEILTNATAGGAATNLFLQIASAPYPTTVINSFQRTGTNAVLFYCAFDAAITASASGNWASITARTNQVANSMPYTAPNEAQHNESTKVYLASDIASALNTRSTNALDQTKTIASQLVGLTNAQTISGVKRLTGANVISNDSQQIIGGVISNVTLYANGGSVSNVTLVLPSITSGLVSNVTLVVANPVFTNGINFGNAFDSPGAGLASHQFGGGTAEGDYSLSIGDGSTAREFGATALGYSAQAAHTNSSAFGGYAYAMANGATAIGASAVSSHANSTAIGCGAQTTGPNQTMIGTATVSVEVNNLLHVGGSILNSALSGQSSIQGDLAFTPRTLTSLANGNNAGIVLGTNVDIFLSGNTTNAAIAGFVAERNGAWHRVILDNPSAMPITILNDSGIEPVAANRILTGTGMDMIFAQSIIPIQLLYSTAKQRWILISGPAYAP